MSDMSRFFASDNDAGIQQVEIRGRSGMNYNPEHPVNVVSPSYDGKTTIVRLLPCWDTTVNPRVEVPFRFGTRYSPWYRSYPAVKSIGTQQNKPTVFLNDPQKQKTWDKNTNPLVILRNEVQRAVSTAEKAQGAFPDGRRLFHGGAVMPHYWSALIKGAQNRGADLPYATSIVICYALVYQHSYGNKVFNDGPPIGLRQDDDPTILEVSGSFWTDTVLKKMNEAVPNYVGPADDFENSLVNGDPISLAFGRFLHIFKVKCDPRQATASLGQLDIYNQQNQAAAGGKEIAGYDGFFTKTLPGYPQDNSQFNAVLQYPPPNDYIANTIRDRYVPLDELVKVATPLEQAKAVYHQFPPEVLLYAWEKYPQFITDELREMAQATMAVNVTTPSTTPMVGPWSPPNAAPVNSPPFMSPGGAPPFNPNVAPANAAPPVYQQPAPAAAPPVYAPPPAAQAAPPVAAPPPPPPAAAPPFANPGGPPMTGFAGGGQANQPSGFNSGAVPPPAAGAPWPTVQPTPAANAPVLDPAASSLANVAGDFGHPPAPAAPPPVTHPVNVPSAPLPAPAGVPPAGASNLDMLRQAAGGQ